MAGKILSRYLILVSIIALIGIGVILAIFYGQYRWMASGIVSSSVAQHGESLSASFERRARGQLYRIADTVSEANVGDASGASGILNRAVADYETLIGLRYTDEDGATIESGVVAEEPISENVLWRPDRLYMKFPVIRGGENVGSLSGSFELTSL
ncbi:MAG: hypothetical protein ACR2QR_05075, partial [Woeseiaceae bacterium]